jgi:hypothetical protein
VIDSRSHEITGNSIVNVGFPIDLGSDLATPNDPAPDADGGANDLQNHPVLTSAALAGGSLVVSGTLTTAPSSSGYRIEVFSDEAGDPEPRTFLGSFTVVPDATGTASFTHTIAASPLPDEVVMATATNLLTRDTSEVGPAVPVETAGTLLLSAETYPAVEGGPVTITVNRTGGSEGTVTVQYATADGTATAPGDYAATSGTLTFGPGVTTQSFSIPIVADGVPEPEETFTVVLSNATGGPTIGTGTATVVIAGHLPPVPTLSEWALLALAAALAAIALSRAVH